MIIERVKLDINDQVVWRAYGAEVSLFWNRRAGRLDVVANRRVRLEWAAGGERLQVVVYMDEDAEEEYRIRARLRPWHWLLPRPCCGSAVVLRPARATLDHIEIFAKTEHLFFNRRMHRTPPG